MRDQLWFLHDPASFAEVAAERSFLKRLGGGCHVPVGARAIAEGARLTLFGVVASPDGSSLYRGETSGTAADGKELGWELAEDLLAQGAESFLVAP
jgi:hydroxymethylbilane synthase